MKINKVDLLVSKIEVKQNKEGVSYLLIDLLDLGSGDNFQLMDKNLERLSQLKQMTKIKANLNLSNSKFGLKLELLDILEQLGGI